MELLEVKPIGIRANLF